jgi:uncharacterized protein
MMALHSQGIKVIIRIAVGAASIYLAFVFHLNRGFGPDNSNSIPILSYPCQEGRCSSGDERSELLVSYGEKEMIPSIETCFRLMDTYEMLKNIRAHSVMVAKVARVIVKGLKDAGLDISVKKTIAGSLLHDIGKTSSLNSGEDHAEIGRQICLQNNFEEIADIVGEHIRLKNYNLNGRYSEKEIVFYADKRVNHDKIVSLEERLGYLIERYGGNREGLEGAIRMNFDLCKEVEKKLFAQLDFGPESLAPLAANEDIESSLY